VNNALPFQPDNALPAQGKGPGCEARSVRGHDFCNFLAFLDLGSRIGAAVCKTFIAGSIPAWQWGRFVHVHAAGTTPFADASGRYRALLTDRSTFSSMTLEELVDADALQHATRRCCVNGTSPAAA
jgi:hypothetical protein